MFVARAAPSPLSRVNTGIATTKAYTVAHAAVPRYSVRIPSSIQARVGLLSGNRWTRPMSQPRKMTAFSCTGLRYCVPAATHTWGTYSTTALSQRVYAIASIPDHSSWIGEQAIYKRLDCFISTAYLFYDTERHAGRFSENLARPFVIRPGFFTSFVQSFLAGTENYLPGLKSPAI